MIIKVERGGGLTGIVTVKEIDANDLPSPLLRAAKKIADNKKISRSPLKTVPRGSADYYTYKISVQEGNNTSVIECNQFNIEHDLKSLVKYVERNSKD